MAANRNPSTHLTVEQCEQLEAAMFEDAAALPRGPKQKEILELAHGYRNLAKIKSWMLGKVN